MKKMSTPKNKINKNILFKKKTSKATKSVFLKNSL